MRSPSSGSLRATLVLYESGPRLGDTLTALTALGRRDCAVVREISKLHEECLTGTVQELADRYANAIPKGEIVVVVGPPLETEAASDEELDFGTRRSTEEPLALACCCRGRGAAQYSSKARLRASA